MATMADIVNGVLVELRFGAGQDVQIHLQEGIVANVSRLYRTLMMKHVWRDYHAINSYVTNANGTITDDITGVITKFSNLLAVYEGTSNVPIPVAPVKTNPATFRRSVLVPNGAASVFTVWPKKARDITVISRNFTEDDFTMEQEVPFYKDLLVVGAAYMLAVKAGVNDRLTEDLNNQFSNLLKIYIAQELQDHYQLNTAHGQFPNEWFVNE